MIGYSTKSILLYGGSFDPIHNGHIHIAREVYDQLDVDKVIFLPAGLPPHKVDRNMTPPMQRYEMVKLALEFEPAFSVSDYEVTMDGPSFTAHTLRYFRSQFTGCRIFWLIGGDSFSQLAKWYKPDQIVDICTVVTVKRPGFELDIEPLKAKLTVEQIDKLLAHVIDIPLTDESSTEVRRRVAAGEPIDDMVPKSVAEYIERNYLYQ